MFRTKTFGAMPKTMPAGFFKAVHFPVLARLDTVTGDGRLLASQGADSRPLPLSIRYQPSALEGHGGAVPSGALFEVTIDPDNKTVSGRGFLLNDVNGRTHARMIHTGAQAGNSADLAEVKARYVEDVDSGERWIEFSQFAFAATTGVGTPAFADAVAVVEPLTDDELTAALSADPMAPLVVTCETDRINIVGAPVDELVASATPRPSFDDFYTPEAAQPQKVVVDADGRVYGHLGLWNSCHDTFVDRCVRIPRPTDGFASFNKPGVLTDRGMVETGPIFAFGGHRPAGSAATIEDAYGGIENSWCDVRVTEGRFGPWVSGRVRPNVDDDVVYAARASRISGHWVGGRLKAIVSVNAEGFDVPGSTPAERDLVAGFAFSVDDGGVSELVASFPSCETVPDGTGQLVTVVVNVAGPLNADSLAAAVAEAFGLDDTADSAVGDDMVVASLLLDEPDL